MPDLFSFSFARSSLDEFIWDLRGLGVDVTACQLDRELQGCVLKAVISENCKVMRFDVGNRMHHLLGAEPGFRTFGLLAREQAPSRIGNRAFGADDLLQMDPDSGLDAVTEAGFAGFTFTVKEARLREVASLLEVDNIASLFRRAGTEKPVPPLLRARMRNYLEQMIANAQAHPDDPAVSVFLEEDLPAMLVQGWCYEQQPRRKTVPLSSRNRALRRAVDLIRSESDEMRTVEQLCKASASSYSTLERAFREHFGLSPKQYLTHARLSGVRQALLKEDGERTLTEVAHMWGFNHMGKFAADYRRQFGELPSHTLRAA